MRRKSCSCMPMVTMLKIRPPIVMQERVYNRLSFAFLRSLHGVSCRLMRCIWWCSYARLHLLLHLRHLPISTAWHAVWLWRKVVRLVRARTIRTLLTRIATSHHMISLLWVSHLSSLTWYGIHQLLSRVLALLRPLMHHHWSSATRTWISAMWLLSDVLGVDMTWIWRVHRHLRVVVLRHGHIWAT